jgi:predicted nuclease of predicted toxin-antitoxin system
MPDDDIFAKAIREGRVILPFDLDFGEIASRCRGERVGVLLFRLNNTRVSHVIERLSHVLNVSAMALESGAVVSVEESRHRVRYFVFGEQHD